MNNSPVKSELYVALEMVELTQFLPFTFYSKLKPNRIHYEGSNYLCDRLSLHSLKLGIMMLGNRDFKDITGFDGFKTMCDSFDRT